MEESDKNFYKQKYAINITLASQLRLCGLLDRIAELEIRFPIDSPEKQKCFLGLVRQYLITAIPYLSSQDSEKYAKQILSLGIKKKVYVRNGTQFNTYQFSPNLDKTLNEILISLQNKLRRVFTKIADDDDDDGL